MSVAQNSEPAAAPSPPATDTTGGRRNLRELLFPGKDDARRKAARSGLPTPPDPSVPWPKRMLTSRMFWLTILLLLLYATCLVLLYRQVVPDQKVPGGRVLGLGHEAVPISAKYAAFTAVPLSLLFLWLDRFKPWRIWVWLMVFLWGACVATYIAAQINTWASSHLSVIGDGDPATSARAAIYVAPWVEEFCKGTVLFGVAVLMRYRWVSRLSGIALAGLAGAGFAFVENILYYGRVYRYAANTFGQVEPEKALQSLFVQRGILTFFGHPLFTSMTGIGLAVAVRSKSKVVRIIAPVAGYCAAAFLHMSFNTAASLVQGNRLLMVYIFVAVPAVLAMIVFIVRQEFREGRLIRERLTDYARVGWLPTADVVPLSRLRTRLRALWQSLFSSTHSPLATLRLQRAATELAYLRDAMTRGIVDDAGLEREKYLLIRIRTVRHAAVIQPAARAEYGRVRDALRIRRHRQQGIPSYAPPNYPGPAGIGGSMPAPQPGSAPIGPAATHYSKVDPNWKPPGE